MRDHIQFQDDLLVLESLAEGIIHLCVSHTVVCKAPRIEDVELRNELCPTIASSCQGDSLTGLEKTYSHWRDQSQFVGGFRRD